MSIDAQWLAYVGIALLAAAAAGAVFATLRDPGSSARGALGRYHRRLERDVRFLQLRGNAVQIVRGQLVAAVALLAAAAVLERITPALLIPVALAGPPLFLRWRTNKRRELLEKQLDGWLLVLANMLKATSSLTDAVSSTASLVSKPSSQELLLVIKEVDLGTTLAAALRAMTARVGSRLVSSAVTALLVGVRTGGDLPRLLEQAASALRELARIDGEVRAKTSQGRMQLFVMALFPPAAYYAFTKVEPEFFDPLNGTVVGMTIYASSFILWLAAIVLARKILNPDV
jgi:tight adherence protein B